MVTINPGDTVPFEEDYILNLKKGEVMGKIKSKANLSDFTSDYTIYFKIKKFLGTYGTYRLDPKLQANNKKL